MIPPFVKRSLSVLLSSQLALSPVMSAHNPDIDDAVKRITPQRDPSLHLNVLGRQTSFKEYFLSTLGHECAFKAFNTTRQSAVALIEEKINAGSVETIHLLDKTIETDVLNQEIKNLFQEGMGAAEKRQRYLTHYKSTTTMVECHQNEGLEAPHNTVSLLDVLSYVYRLDLRVYILQENTPHSLQLFHKKDLQESKGVVSLLLKNSHYNLLLRENDPHALHVSAATKEEIYLQEYRAKLTKDAQETQRALAQLTHTENSLEDEDFSYDTQTPSSSELTSLTPRTPLSCMEERSQQPRAVRSSSQGFQHKSMVDFLNRKTKNLPGGTYQNSLASVWQCAKDLLDKPSTSHLEKVTERINASLYQSALVLDHGFIPLPQTKRATLDELKKTLQTALREARRHSHGLGRHYSAALHHMAVYLGRCLASVGDHELAWETLSSTLWDGYTRSASLEMARLVLEEGYKPQDIGTLTPEAYALSLLDKTRTPKPRSEISLTKTKGVRAQITFVHTPYLNSKEGRAFAKTLKAIAKNAERRARRGVSHDENIPRLSTTLSSRSQAPTQGAQGPLASVLFPSTPTSRASSVTARNKRPYEAFLADHGGLVTELLQPRPKRIVIPMEESDEENTSSSGESDDRLTISDVSEDERFLETSLADAFEDEVLTDPDEESDVDAALAVTATLVPLTSLDDDEVLTDPDEDTDVESALAITVTLATLTSLEDVQELLMRAGIAGMRGEDQQAQGFCLNALEKLQTLNAPHLQAKVFFLLGHAHFEGEIGDQRYRGTDCYLEGLRLATGIHDQKLMAQAYVGLGHAQFEGEIGGQNRTRIDCYLEGLRLATQIRDQKFMAQALIGLGHAQFEGEIGGQNRTRIDCYLEGLRVAMGIPDQKLRAQALIGLGNAQFEGKIGDQRYKDTDCYLEGLRVATGIHDLKLMAQALIGLGHVQFEGEIGGQNRTRIDCYLEGLRLATGIHDPKLMAQALIGLGHVQFKGKIGDQRYKDTDCYLEGLRVATGIRDQKLMAQALIGLGNAQFEGKIGDKRYKDTDCYLEGLRLATQIRDQKLMAQALIGLGHVQFEGKIGDKRYTRTDCYLEGLRLATQIRDQKLMAQAYVGLGHAQFEGEIDSQRYTRTDCYLEGLRLATQIHDQKLMAQALISLGNAQFKGRINGQRYRGTDCYLEGLRLATGIHDPKLMAQAYVGLGHAQFEGEIDSQRYTRTDCYLEGLYLGTEIRDQKLMAQAYVSLGNNQFEGRINGQRYRGIDCYLEGLRLAMEIRDQKLMTQAHLGMGNTYCAQRNNAKGLEHFEQAQTMAQRLGNQLLIQKAKEGVARAKRFLSQNSHHRSARPGRTH